MKLPDRILALDGSLGRARIPHAFGGALALAFWTRDPRGTDDIDLNLFVPARKPQPALRALPEGIALSEGAAEEIVASGQVRLWWDEVPLDLFFDYLPLHAQAAANRRFVPFAGGRIPVLGPVELAVFKVMFDRTRDWADVEAMLEAGTLDAGALGTAIADLLEAGDRRFARLAEAERRASGQPPRR